MLKLIINLRFLSIEHYHSISILQGAPHIPAQADPHIPAITVSTVSHSCSLVMSVTPGIARYYQWSHLYIRIALPQFYILQQFESFWFVLCKGRTFRNISKQRDARTPNYYFSPNAIIKSRVYLRSAYLCCFYFSLRRNLFSFVLTQVFLL